MFKYSVFVITFLALVTFGQTNEILDLVCDADADCDIFKSSAINSSCIFQQCHCVDVDSGNQTTCKPTVTKASNQIGGQCPCISDNSYCNEKTQLCVCKEGYLPSKGGKKCISKTVALGHKCELDEQCITNDHFSLCDDVHHNCTCLNRFVMYQNACHSIISVNSETPCEHDADCSNRTANSVCHEKQCICGKGFVANAENTTCLAVARYEQDCIDSNQCIFLLGVGSICNENKCVCNEQHFPFAVEAHDNKTEENKVCKRKITHGASCNNDKECYQFHLGHHEQTMECFMNECVCSQTHFERDGVCLSLNAAAMPGLSMLLLFFTLLLITCNK